MEKKTWYMFCRSTILWVKQQLVERNLKAEHFKLNVTRANSCWTRYVSLNGKFFIRPKKKKFFCFDNGWWIFVSFVRKPYFKVYIFWCYRPSHIFPRRVLSIFQYKSSPPFLRWVTSLRYIPSRCPWNLSFLEMSAVITFVADG